MLKTTRRTMRSLALLTGTAVLGLTLIHPAPAQANDKKEKLYKGGAAALGVLGAYWILEGKTVPGAAAAAGAYYAYKKGRDLDREDSNYRYDDRYNDRYNNRHRNDRDRRSDRDRNRRDTYPDYRYDDYRYDSRTGGYRDGYRDSNGRYSSSYGYSAATPSVKNESRPRVVLQ